MMKLEKIWNHCYTLSESIIEKDDEWKYHNTWKIWKTTIFIFRDDKWKIEKIHLQNYSKLKFAQERKIEKDDEYCFKIMKTKIKAIDLEKFLDDWLGDNWNWLQEFFIHRLIEKAQEIQKTF